MVAGFEESYGNGDNKIIWACVDKNGPRLCSSEVLGNVTKYPWNYSFLTSPRVEGGGYIC